jgi:hypothetical protein
VIKNYSELGVLRASAVNKSGDYTAEPLRAQRKSQRTLCLCGEKGLRHCTAGTLRARRSGVKQTLCELRVSVVNYSSQETLNSQKC